MNSDAHSNLGVSTDWFYQSLTRAHTHLSYERFDQAEEIFFTLHDLVLSNTKLFEILPNHKIAQIHIGIGIIENAREKFPLALKSFEKALDFHSTSQEIYFNKALSYYFLKQYKLAISDLTTAIHLSKEMDSSILFYNRALCYFETQNYKQAIKDFDVAISEKPGDAHLFYSKALALASLHEYQNAARELETALQIAPEYIEAQLLLGTIHLDLNRYDLASEIFQNILQIDGSNIYAKNKLDFALKKIEQI
jgi:tetratricopeptide (TPR) repeat protein